MTNTNMLDLLLLQKKDIWEHEDWIVPLSVALEGLTSEQAAWIPPGGGNSIWQLVHHMNYYNHELLCHMQNIDPGPRADNNNQTFEYNDNADHEEQWQQALHDTRRLAKAIELELAKWDEMKLQEIRPAGDQTWGQAIARWLPHDAYHAGQIVLIRRLQGSWRI